MSKQASFRTATPARRQRGITLIETLCATSVLATAMGLAAPAMESWKLRQALLSSATELETDIQLARSSAVALNQTVRMETQATGNGTCYIVHTGTAHECKCDGNGNALCTGPGRVLRLAEHGALAPVHLATTKTSIAFDPGRGTVSPTATLKLVDRQARSVHLVVNIMGRVRNCSPQGAIVGVKAC